MLREDKQQLLLLFTQALPQPQAVLYLKFKYPLRQGMSGFYRCVLCFASVCAGTGLMWRVLIGALPSKCCPGATLPAPDCASSAAAARACGTARSAAPSPTL